MSQPVEKKNNLQQMLAVVDEDGPEPAYFYRLWIHNTAKYTHTHII